MTLFPFHSIEEPSIKRFFDFCFVHRITIERQREKKREIEKNETIDVAFTT